MYVIKNSLRERYTQFPNSIIEDTRLSDKSCRVLSYLFSKNSDWKVYNKDIQNKLNIKQSHTLSKCWKELMDLGYIVRERQKGKDGKISGGYIYHIMEVPQCANNHIVEKPIYGENHKHINTKDNNNTKDNSNTNNIYAKKSLSDRINDWIELARSEIQPTQDQEYIFETFINYWTAYNSTDKKFKAEKEKSFYFKQRFSTFLKNSSRNNNQVNKNETNLDRVFREMINREMING